MKLCICGKGGSGKSTIVCMLAWTYKRKGRDVIVLDSDESNTSLAWMLGFTGPPKPLMDFIGGKKSVQEKMIARFSKGDDEPTMSIWEAEKITSSSMPSNYIAVQDRLKLISTGKIHQALEGCACPMGTVTREFLKKFELAADEIMLVDMEAGLEHFGRGVETSVDGVICVVEPSLESISLAEKVMNLTQSSGAVFAGAVLNKITSEAQKLQIIERLCDHDVRVIGTVWHQDAIQAAGLNGRPVSVDFASAAFDDISDILLRGTSENKRARG
jgi:CO dehydrogenase maturation factor